MTDLQILSKASKVFVDVNGVDDSYYIRISKEDAKFLLKQDDGFYIVPSAHNVYGSCTVGLRR